MANMIPIVMSVSGEFQRLQPTDSLVINGLTVGPAGDQVVISYFSLPGAGIWFDLPTTGPSGIGTGGQGQQAWLGYCFQANNWCSDSLAGDLAFRNISGRLLFGTSVGPSQMSISTNGITASAGINSCGNAGGTANALTLTPHAGNPSAYQVGAQYTFTATSTNTGAVTVNIGGLGNLTTTMGGAAIAAGGLVANNVYVGYIEANLTNMRISPFDSVGVSGDTMQGPLLFKVGSGQVNQSISTTVTPASGTSTLTPSNSSPTISNGTQIWSQSITPLASTSKISINGSILFDCSSNSKELILMLFRGNVCIGVATNTCTSSGKAVPLSFNITDSPGVITNTTYSIRVALNTSGTWYVNQTSTSYFNGLQGANGILVQELA